ncbi:MAG: sialate O-acetylesterase [Verrucomicrobiota bacterium]
MRDREAGVNQNSRLIVGSNRSLLTGMTTRKTLFPTLLLIALSATVSAKDYHVYFLGGQSNMDGYGFVKELPAELAKPMPDVPIFHGNMGLDGKPVDGRGIWSPLQPGHGRSFKSDGKTNIYSDRFGLELSFARRIKTTYQRQNVAIIKYSRGGTSIEADCPSAERFGCWEVVFERGEGEGKGMNQFDHFLATLANARKIKDIDGDGEPDRLIPSGILWMQGESDATGTLQVAEDYGKNLAELMFAIRDAFNTPDMPIVIGRITDWEVWTHGEVVRAEQAAFAAKDPRAELVTSTDTYGNSDKWHYDTAGYLDLGVKFADAIVHLRRKALNDQ